MFELFGASIKSKNNGDRLTQLLHLLESNLLGKNLKSMLEFIGASFNGKTMAIHQHDCVND